MNAAIGRTKEKIVFAPMRVMVRSSATNSARDEAPVSAYHVGQFEKVADGGSVLGVVGGRDDLHVVDNLGEFGFFQVRRLDQRGAHAAENIQSDEPFHNLKGTFTYIARATP